MISSREHSEMAARDRRFKNMLKGINSEFGIDGARGEGKRKSGQSHEAPVKVYRS